MARGLHDPLPLTPRRARLAAGRCFAMLAKSGDPAEHLFKQHLRVALPFLCDLPNLPSKLAEANQHVIASAGEAFVHLLSERPDFDAYLLPKLGLDARKPGVQLVAHGGELCPHLAPDGRKLGPHFGAYVRELNAHFAAELHNLRLYRAYSLTENPYSLIESRHRRRQWLESVHSLFQAFYAFRQQFIRHHSSVPTRRSNSKRALDGRTKERRMPTTLPSSLGADNSFRIRTDGWRHIDAMSTLEVA